MKRGDLVTIAMQGDYGKPRPALVIQADAFDELATVAVLPVTSTLVAAPLFRIDLLPDAANGLRKPSQVMVDKPIAARRERIGQVIGHVDADLLVEVERSLVVFLGIAR